MDSDELRPRPPNCCPNGEALRDENEPVGGDGDGPGWWAGTPMAMPPLCGCGGEGLAGTDGVDPADEN